MSLPGLGQFGVFAIPKCSSIVFRLLAMRRSVHRALDSFE